jgi:hypothetical protein
MPDFWVSTIEINLSFGQQNDIYEPKKAQGDLKLWIWEIIIKEEMLLRVQIMNQL